MPDASKIAVIVAIITSMLSSGIFTAIVTFLMREWIGERIKNSIKSEYDLKLEEHKRKLELEFGDQVKRRVLYEEVTTALENAFGSGRPKTAEELTFAMNRLFARLALSAPDDIYLATKEALIDRGTVYGKDAKPRIYYAIRKSLFGDSTKLGVADLVPHISATVVPATPVTPKPPSTK
jgi:hypothetical protein